MGNRLTSLGVAPYTYDVSNELTSQPGVSYAYDGNGNLASKTDGTGLTTYAWDFDNRLTRVTLLGGAQVTIQYDPLGRRIQKTSASGTVNYVYDRANVLEEVDTAGNLVARYTQGLRVDEPLALLRAGTTSYYQADGLGSITSLTSSSATMVSTYTYDAFGKLTASSGTIVNPYRFTSRDWDQEAGLYYYRARYYSPGIGRFVGEDPIGFAGGVNFYDYVLNNPVTFSDPFGLKRRRGESLTACLNREAKAFYGPVLDHIDAASPLSVIGIGAEALSNLARTLGQEEVKSLGVAGAAASGSIVDKIAASKAASAVASRLGVETATLGVLSEASSVIGVGALSFSFGARVAFLPSCLDGECP